MPFQTISQTARQPAELEADQYPALTACRQLVDLQKPSSHMKDSFYQLSAEEVTDEYHQAIYELENHIWQHDKNDEYSQLHQQLYRELEQQLAMQATDKRHEFVVVIPVADRPKQLDDIINSLIEQCEYFGYGGHTNGYFNKLSIIIADDSCLVECIEHNRQLAANARKSGLRSEYFGRDEQYRLYAGLAANQHNLEAQIGTAELAHDEHRGSSIMRNLCYLYLNQRFPVKQDRVFYFVDSDQVFNVDTGNAGTYPVNYFYHLDRVFSRNKVSVVTGKVVGDPPVSPAVMANTFLDDVLLFLDKIRHTTLHHACQFHADRTDEADQAAYHDMAELFGFAAAHQPHQYECLLSGKHTNLQCLISFSSRLNHFFHGEHPTRSTRYHYANPVNSMSAARTVYTGNYAFKATALVYFIPFSDLRLRMAGPTLGRILQSALGKRFVSVNLPMRHKRTLDSCGTAEYRVGVNQQDNQVDLTTEFIRQYYGDVMLFSIKQLSEQDLTMAPPEIEQIRKTVNSTARSLHDKYQANQSEILGKLDKLTSGINTISKHLEEEAAGRKALHELQTFLSNIQSNFSPDSRSFQLINDTAADTEQLEAIISAISSYHLDLGHWHNALASQR